MYAEILYTALVRQINDNYLVIVCRERTELNDDDGIVFVARVVYRVRVQAMDVETNNTNCIFHISNSLPGAWLVSHFPISMIVVSLSAILVVCCRTWSMPLSQSHQPPHETNAIQMKTCRKIIQTDTVEQQQQPSDRPTDRQTY